MKPLLIPILIVSISIISGVNSSLAQNKNSERLLHLKELLESLRNEGLLDENFSPITREGFEELKKAGVLREDLNTDAAFEYSKATSILEDTKTYRDKEKLQKVIKGLKEAIKIDPKYSLAYFTLGNTYSYISSLSREDQKLYQSKAESAWRKALELKPEYEEDIKIHREDMLFHTFPSEAEIKREKAEDYRSKGALLLSSEPGMKLDKVKCDEAIKNFKKAIEIDPSYINAYSSLGRAYYYSGMYTEAESTLEKAIKMDPKSAILHLQLARCFGRQNKYNEAIGAYKTVLELDPNNKEADRYLKKIESQSK